MSKLTRYGVPVLVGLCLPALFYRIEISQYLFDPEGLSLAPGEVCLTNMSEGSVVAEIAVRQGASSKTFLTPGETACSAAPSEESAAMIRVSIEDGVPPYCEQNGQAGKVNKLTRFDPPSNCGWVLE